MAKNDKTEKLTKMTKLQIDEVTLVLQRVEKKRKLKANFRLLFN